MRPPLRTVEAQTQESIDRAHEAMLLDRIKDGFCPIEHALIRKLGPDGACPEPGCPFSDARPFPLSPSTITDPRR